LGLAELGLPKSGFTTSAPFCGWKISRLNFFAFLAVLSVRIVTSREDFGLRWQSTAATPLFNCGQSFQSGVALRFPPQFKKIWLWLGHAGFFAVQFPSMPSLRICNFRLDFWRRPG
jgi:hypothetical protein